MLKKRSIHRYDYQEDYYMLTLTLRVNYSRFLWFSITIDNERNHFEKGFSEKKVEHLK